jgi:hypothetical protein
MVGVVAIEQICPDSVVVAAPAGSDRLEVEVEQLSSESRGLRLPLATAGRAG